MHFPKPTVAAGSLLCPRMRRGRGGVVVSMNTPGRTAVADPDSGALCSSPVSLPERDRRAQRCSSSLCISVAHACQKINLSSQTALERLRGISSVCIAGIAAMAHAETLFVSLDDLLSY